MNYKTIKERLELINSSQQIEELYSIFYSIDEGIVPLIHFNMEVGTYVIRQRINNKDKEFTTISELTYPPISACKRYGRANIPYHPMFYCCTFADDFTSPLPRYVSILETSDFVKSKETIGIERSTCSRWDVIERLDLLALPFSTEYERTIPIIKQIQDEWEVVKQEKGINNEALELVEYMSNEIAKDITNNDGYFKIANFIYYLLYINEQTKEIDGIIYPSVAAAGEGINIVLKPETVDKKLKFSVASLCYIVKNGERAEVDIVNHSIQQNEDGTLLYELMDDYNKEKYKNETFIN